MNNETSMSLATLVVAGLVIFLLLLWVRSAEPAAICLTKKEARALWPRQHIYWYSKDHCWSNRRGPPRGLQLDPIFGSHAQAEEKKPLPDKVIKVVRGNEFNELDAAADADTFFRAEPIPYWRFSALDDGFDTWKRRVEDLLK
jgi:hypothetical protein